MLLELGAREFLHATWSSGALFAAAQNPLALQQQNAAGGIAENGYLHQHFQVQHCSHFWLSISHCWSKLVFDRKRSLLAGSKVPHQYITKAIGASR